MSYTFVSARYGNPQHTAAVAITEEAGAVAMSEIDTPEAWAALLSSGKEIASYAEPPALTPDEISDRQFAQCLAARGIISEQEAENWVGPGIVPAPMLALVDKLPQTERFAARMLLRGATRFQRKHPIVEQIGSLSLPPWTPDDLDTFWREAAAL